MPKDDRPDLRVVTGDEEQAPVPAVVDEPAPSEPDPVGLYLDLLRAGSGTHASLQAAELSMAELAELRESDEFVAREAEALAAARELVEDALFQAASSGNLPSIVEFYRRTAEPDPLLLELAAECRNLAKGT